LSELDRYKPRLDYFQRAIMESIEELNCGSTGGASASAVRQRLSKKVKRSVSFPQFFKAMDQLEDWGLIHHYFDTRNKLPGYDPAKIYEVNDWGRTVLEDSQLAAQTAAFLAEGAGDANEQRGTNDTSGADGSSASDAP
jgi:hypothetical protein